jgi:osmotically-inducible protein OsmY
MKKIMFIICLSLSLQGCIAGAIVAGSAAGGVVASDNRSFASMEDDQKITYQASRKIAADPVLARQGHVTIESYNRDVLLAGQVPSPELRDQVVSMVKDIPHVKRIFNELTIGQPTTFMQRSKDAVITANVKSRMFATTNLKASQIKVVTEDRVVYLMGLTSVSQAQIAARVARNSTGVKRVVKLIEYLYTAD